MVDSGRNFWIVISNFTKTGIEPRHQTENLPLNKPELKIITNYYASMLNYISAETIVGPLPVAYHPELSVLLYRYTTIDHEFDDERVQRKGGETIALLTVFYKIEQDEVFLHSRMGLQKLFASWIGKNREISNVNPVTLEALSESVERVKQKGATKKNIIGTTMQQRLVIRQLDFLTKFIKETYTIQIISEKNQYLNSLKKVLLKFGYNSITSFEGNQNQEDFQVTINSMLNIYGNHISTAQIVEKDKSYILIANIDGKATSTLVTKTSVALIENLEQNELCLFCNYSETGDTGFEESPLFEPISHAFGKNISLATLESGEILEPFIHFLYQLLEKMQ